MKCLAHASLDPEKDSNLSSLSRQRYNRHAGAPRSLNDTGRLALALLDTPYDGLLRFRPSGFHCPSRLVQQPVASRKPRAFHPLGHERLVRSLQHWWNNSQPYLYMGKKEARMAYPLERSSG